MSRSSVGQARGYPLAKQRLPSLVSSRTLFVGRNTTRHVYHLEDVYCSPDVAPAEYTGPVQVVAIPGRGRGVVASTDLGPGQLVMVSKALAYVTCPMGDIPSADELADKIRETSYSQEELRTLLSLYGGEEGDEEDANGEQQGYGDELDDFKLYGIIGCNSFGEEFTDFPTALARAARLKGTRGSDHGTNQASSSAANNTTSSSCAGTVSDVCHNGAAGSAGGAQGGAQQRGSDAGARDGGWVPHSSSCPSSCASQQQQQQQQQSSRPNQEGHLGLFPSFSMLNHSCLPNAVNFVVAGHMLVLAARHIPRGSEVLINYLGRASLRPVAERQGQLAEGYHFSCDCPRCRLELLAECASEGGGANVGAAGRRSFSEGVQAILERCEERAAVLDSLLQPVQPQPPAAATAAAAASDQTWAPADGSGAAPTGPDSLLASLRQDVRELDELAEQHAAGVPAEVLAPGADPSARQSWLAAAAFDLYGQHVAAAEAAGRREEAVAALERQVAVCEAVAAHSDLHMYLAVKLLSLLQQQEDPRGPASPRAVEQLRRCVGVLRGRYGAELSDGAAEVLLQGAAYGLSQVVV